MKFQITSVKIFFVFLLLTFTFTSCIVHHPSRVVVVKAKRLPPGQAKKIYGGSAKDYAPGQHKKKHRD
ncbi:quinol oxidase subunit 4 [Flavobacterium sp.]|uniref:quinol oxidase subunit 4 n=1 Tax=Flavobacterium sp. TaxID=239 RepID=UPI00374D1F21